MTPERLEAIRSSLEVEDPLRYDASRTRRAAEYDLEIKWELLLEVERLREEVLVEATAEIRRLKAALEGIAAGEPVIYYDERNVEHYSCDGCSKMIEAAREALSPA